MATQDVEFDGEVRFVAERDSHQVRGPGRPITGFG